MTITNADRLYIQPVLRSFTRISRIPVMRLYLSLSFLVIFSFKYDKKNVSKILAVSSNTCLDQLSLLDRKNVFQLFYSMEGPLFTTIFHMFKFI